MGNEFEVVFDTKDALNRTDQNDNSYKEYFILNTFFFYFICNFSSLKRIL